ncbi:MAG: patatin-like phospholipase family protein [Bacteroidales bacterium]|nr:patatin-like phospholipase family protein [Bacteroidales bacterium]
METTKTKDTFYIGLCMAGAVSAGAYTAGVLDYLIEALDTWENMKKSEEKHIPSHKVVIPVTGGASAGGMTSIILASAINNPVIPIRKLEGNILKEQPQNKFYHSWVDLTGKDMFSTMLSNGDIKKSGTITSLLNSDFIEEIAAKLLDVDKTKWLSRYYIAEHLKIFVTLSNLKGYEFNVAFKGAASQTSPYYINRHNDYACFTLNKNREQYENDGWMPLDFKTSLNVDVARDSAMATGAFPIGLRARRVTREGLYVNQLSWLKDVISLNPILEGNYESLFVDGGLINNEPFDRVRDCLIELTGEKKKNYESYEKFKSTVLMIDPFPSEPCKFTDNDQLGNVTGKTFSTMMNQLRDKPTSLVDAWDSDNAGQFLISPSRSLKTGNEIKHLQGSRAIACGTLGGFGGFLNKEFRVHDFFLGRANCEKFLRDYFTVPADTKNPIFRNGYKHIPQEMFISQVDGKRQIIPIFTERTKEPYLPKFSSGTNWPTLKNHDIDRFRPKLKLRVQELALHMGKTSTITSFIIWVICKGFLNGFTADKMIGSIKKSLKQTWLIK